MIQGVQALVNGSGVEKVAEYVEKGLASAFTAAADFILSFFHLDAIPKTIRQVSDKWVGIVQRKLAELLGRLKGALLEQLQKLWGGYWGRAEWTAGNEKHKIWVDFRSGKVLVASTVQEARARLKDLRRRAAKNEKASVWVEKAEDVLKAAETAVKEAKSATAASGKKGISESERAAAVKAAQSASKKAKVSLREFANYAGEAEKALESLCSKGRMRDGEQGLLVHNASAPCDPCAQRWPSGRRGLKYIDFDTITITYKETMRDPNNPNKRITIGMQKSVQFKKVKQLIARLKYYGPDPTREPINTTRDWFRGDSSIGYESDTPGHILANIFGGYANVARGNGNLFPQNEYVNENTLNYFERDQIKPEVIKPDSDVCIQIDFYFGSPGKPDRPITFDYSYWFNGVFQEKKPFTNPK